MFPVKSLYFKGFLGNTTPHFMAYFDPDVLQSGFAVNLLLWPGEFQENFWRISQRISMASLDSVFQGFRLPQKIHAPKFTPTLVGISLQFHFLKPIFFFTPIAYGETNIFRLVFFFILQRAPNSEKN